jgi:hypothetical protein
MASLLVNDRQRQMLFGVFSAFFLTMSQEALAHIWADTRIEAAFLTIQNIHGPSFLFHLLKTSFRGPKACVKIRQNSRAR